MPVVSTGRGSCIAHDSFRRTMTKVDVICIVATFALLVGACSDDEKKPSSDALSSAGAGTTTGNSGVAGQGAPTGPANVDFDTCMAALQPTCSAMEMNTAEKMETPCKEITLI